MYQSTIVLSFVTLYKMQVLHSNFVDLHKVTQRKKHVLGEKDDN